MTEQTNTVSTGNDVMSKPEPKLTREQRRFMERIEQEARKTHADLSEKFFNAFMESDDPEGKEMEELFASLDSKWKMYCHRRRLNESAYKLFGKDCAQLIAEYNARKKESSKEEIKDNAAPEGLKP
jgi:hypothetical protein